MPHAAREEIGEKGDWENRFDGGRSVERNNWERINGEKELGKSKRSEI